MSTFPSASTAVLAVQHVQTSQKRVAMSKVPPQGSRSWASGGSVRRGPAVPGDWLAEVTDARMRAERDEARALLGWLAGGDR